MKSAIPLNDYRRMPRRMQLDEQTNVRLVAADLDRLEHPIDHSP
jgi:hypothetical protein